MSDGGGNRWLRSHFHEFVFPAFMAAEKRSSEIGKPFDVKPSDKAPEQLPTELKKLWTLCMEHKVPWDFDVREINVNSGSSKYRESARIHHQIVIDNLNSAMAALHQEKCSKLFLGGRDVWAFAVACARRKIPFLFIPELSRHVTSKPGIRQFLESHGFDGSELFLDTGFAGSIPRNLQQHWPGLNFRFRLMSQSDIHVVEDKSKLVDCDPSSGKTRKLIHRYRRRPQQLFPNHAKAREAALETEYLAKYWRSGTWEHGLPITTGQVNAVFQEWPKKEGVFKFSRKPGHVCLCDSKEVVEVSVADAKRIEPMLVAWMAALPDGVVPERVVQYFSDKRTIARAALLTSMLWRGIPFWKAAMTRAAQKAQQGLGFYAGNNFQGPVGQLIPNGINVVNNFGTSSVATYTIGTSGSTVGTTVTATDFGLLNNTVQHPWTGTGGAGASQYLEQAAAQMVGQPLNDQTKSQIAALANMMAKADTAMGKSKASGFKPEQWPPTADHEDGIEGHTGQVGPWEDEECCEEDSDSLITTKAAMIAAAKSSVAHSLKSLQSKQMNLLPAHEPEPIKPTPIIFVGPAPV
jgi:hypothetical protein